MEKYNKYKDSGIEFASVIPNEWGVTRLKNLGFLQNGVSKGKDYFGFGFPFVSYGNVYNDTVDLKEIKKLANSTVVDQKLYSVLEGDVFFTRTSETIDEIGISATALLTIPKATFSGFIIRLRPKKNKVYKGFTKYYFQGNINRIFLSKQINIVTRASLSQSILNNLPVLLPPLKEQTQIANYLDGKTTAIDKKVKLLQQKIKHYKAYRKTLINETVTKGLDKTVKLKDSGINWIGEIPEHWEVKRYKSFGKTIKGKNMEMSDLEFDNSLPLLSLEYLRNDSVQHPTFCYSSDKSLKSTDEDLIIVWDGAAVGEILKSKVGYVSSTIAKLDINKKKFNTRYFYHLRGAIDYKLKQIPTGMGIPHLNPTLFKNFKCPSPPIKEQQQIADYLDIKTSTIDKVVKNIETQITTLKELRKTLINEVVTGKVKVTSTPLSHQEKSNQPKV